MKDNFKYFLNDLKQNYPYCIKILLEKLEHCWLKATNQEYKKYPKFLSKQIKEQVLKTLGTS